MAVVLVTSVFVAWTMLAYSGARHSALGRKTIAPASLNPDTPSKEYIYAGSRLVATEEPAGCGGAPSEPINLLATATTENSVNLVWTAPAGGADHYEIERSSNFGAPNNGFAFVTNVVGTSHSDAPLNSNTAYLYRVRAFDSANCPSPYSDIDLATTALFTEAVEPGVTIKAEHLLELRTAVNAVRGTAGLPSFNWSDPPATETPAIGGTIKKEQMQKLRDKLDLARSDMELAPQPYTDQPLTLGTPVKAVHILQLRDGVK